MPEQPVQPRNPELPPVPKPEIPTTPEKLPEQQHEQEWKPEFLEQEETPTTSPPVQPSAPKPVEPAAPPRSLFVKEVEHVLSEGLDQTYQQLDAVTKRKFKEVGEQTAEAVTELLEQAKVQSKKVLELIVRWLKIIPGVNKFFLEQEAKIKTDKLLALRQPHEKQ